MKFLVRATTVAGVLALGFAGLAGTASAAPTTSLEVCSPLGCAVQSVQATIGPGELFTTLTDNSPTAALIAQFIVSPPSQTSIVHVNDGVFHGLVRLPSGWKQLTVKACSTPTNCNSKSIIRL
ncbi:hypothetical protein [Amycolatopsis sp. BJA-103]|uniref:hypothetical protein n=1 Tax=unclassified Amycolatopsis TaxID=2618356 RepID=UPI000C7864CE|nr:hypothetical protein [Amycolatopsis sp. BJA-103]AUI64939.1 hypothetical protein BKN51_36605 [Amycolatopsis sp. BJA-103]PNE19691.1 hypothetical protein B1H26_14310 [Amycolatopsis sp. BJA-103]